MAGCQLLSFLDCYFGYYQISLKPKDEDKTMLIMPYGSYCYNNMTFGLKNARATYQNAIQLCLKDQISCNAEAYMDDVVVKTHNPSTLITDLEETFTNVRKYRLKLNPKKCLPLGSFRASWSAIEA